MRKKVNRIDSIKQSGCGNSNSNSSSRRNSNSGIYGQLRSRLESMSFQSFRTLVFLWLNTKGYRKIFALKRSGSRGRRAFGGADFLATSPYFPRDRVAIQIRHWKSPVQKRIVDEFRGFMLRQGISQGLIVTNSRFFPGALKVAREDSKKPVKLWSSAQLAGSMAVFGLGVERVEGQHQIADWFFKGLNQVRIGWSLPRKRRLLPDSASGPEFGRNWPDISWWLLLTVILALLLSMIFGGLQ
jgi:restriction endonuclease Mrr